MNRSNVTLRLKRLEDERLIARSTILTAPTRHLPQQMTWVNSREVEFRRRSEGVERCSTSPMHPWRVASSSDPELIMIRKHCLNLLYHLWSTWIQKISFHVKTSWHPAQTHTSPEVTMTQTMGMKSSRKAQGYTRLIPYRMTIPLDRVERKARRRASNGRIKMKTPLVAQTASVLYSDFIN